jgi:FtsH-binding integral membrane protein
MPEEGNEVFDRTKLEPGESEISEGLYNFMIGLVLSYGFLTNMLMVKYIPAAAVLGFNPWIFFIGYFASCFFGVFLYIKSSNPWVSFLGYNFVVVPFGLVINIVVSQYSQSLVVEAVQITGLVTLSMMVLGTLFPAFFRRIATALTISLLLVIVWELVATFVFKKVYGVIDWIVVLIFCGYIGVDWGRANQIPKTVDNAIDSAAALYMDIINLFLRILRILGRRK